MAKKFEHTILIVDDEPDSLRLLNDCLGSAGFRTLFAENGEAGLKSVSLVKPDIILLDVMMPGIDGFETCRRLKKNETTKEIPVLFMTALTDVVNKIKGFEVGAVDFITKPIHVEEVIARINTHLTLRNLQKKLEKQNTQLKNEIVERKRAEEKITAALNEREVLLREIHHRVKNNLQIISSLLSLQSRYIDDKRAPEVFKNCQDRVHAMALIHEKLYQSGDLSKIDFRGYARSLISRLFISYALKPEQVQLNMEIENVDLTIEEAIPIGLIINELISNSLKHAFPNYRKGAIEVSLGVNKGEGYDYSLIVGDNGIGLPDGLNLENSATLGMLLVHSLVKQLNGVIDLYRKNGTRFDIKFKH